MKFNFEKFRYLLAIVFLLVGLSATAEEQTWKVSMKDADIRAFISQISDITGFTFVIDPRVKGKVTVVSNAPMNKDSIYDMFLAVLQVHGFAAIPGDGIIKVVQQNSAKQIASNEKQSKRLPSEQIVTRVIQIKNANALELVPILRPMVAKYGHLAGVSAANALIISDHLANIKRISGIINELDSPSKYQLEVVQLKAAWVGDMVKLLEELAPNELGKGKVKAAARKYSVVADQRSNRLILRGDETFREKIKKLIVKLDQPSTTGGRTKVIRLRNADAKSLADTLKGLMGDISNEKAKGKGQNKPEASVYADDSLNALVIRAEPSILKEMEEIIRQLDVRRAQVLIEAAIVEISDDNSEAHGVQWALFDQGGTVPGVATNFSQSGLNSTNNALGLIGASSSDIASSGVSLADGLTLGVGDTRDGFTWGALIQALQNNASTNVLSTPKIITMDNQESSIIVGENIPIITGQSTSGGDGTSNPFTTIEREDVGVKLTVTPSISEGDLVRLEIQQEISGVNESAATGADIRTTKREIKTNVLADNGQTIVLGGLIKDNVLRSESKVPILGDIPWLGELFKSKSTTKEKQNLLVYLRPTILRDKRKTQEVSEKKFDELWQLNLDFHRKAEDLKNEELKNIRKPAMEELYQSNELKIEQQ